jgi:hypothetical protein
MTNDKGSSLGWVVAGLAIAVLVAAFEIGSATASAHQPLRSKHADPAVSGTPAEMMVVVSKDGKTFHAAGCRYIHDHTHEQTITAQQAINDGYVPCIRCMRKYAR